MKNYHEEVARVVYKSEILKMCGGAMNYLMTPTYSQRMQFMNIRVSMVLYKQVINECFCKNFIPAVTLLTVYFCGETKIIHVLVFLILYKKCFKCEKIKAVSIQCKILSNNMYTLCTEHFKGKSQILKKTFILGPYRFLNEL